MQWLRRSFITGFFVTVPLIVSVAALVWAFRVVDDFATPVATRVLGRAVPGLGVLIMATLVLGVGAGATNVFGKRVLQQAEGWLLRVPVFKTVYAPVRQLVAAFSPDNEAGFKRVVLVEDPGRGLILGFLTREFTLDRGAGGEAYRRRLRADESSLPGRHRGVPQESRALPGPDGGRRGPDFSHWRHGAADRTAEPRRRGASVGLPRCLNDARS